MTADLNAAAIASGVVPEERYLRRDAEFCDTMNWIAEINHEDINAFYEEKEEDGDTN